MSTNNVTVSFRIIISCCGESYSKTTTEWPREIPTIGEEFAISLNGKDWKVFCTNVLAGTELEGTITFLFDSGDQDLCSFLRDSSLHQEEWVKIRDIPASIHPTA